MASGLRAMTGWKSTALPGIVALAMVFLAQLGGFGVFRRIGQLGFDAYNAAQP